MTEKPSEVVLQERQVEGGAIVGDDEVVRLQGCPQVFEILVAHVGGKSFRVQDSDHRHDAVQGRERNQVMPSACFVCRTHVSSCAPVTPKESWPA